MTEEEIEAVKEALLKVLEESDEADEDWSGVTWVIG